MLFKTKKGDKSNTLQIEIFKKCFIFTYVNLKNKVYTSGIRNITEDNKRLLFLDYDKQNLDLCIIPEIKYLQKEYNLSDAYILESSKNSYHVIFFDVLDFLEWIEILKKTSCDSVYKNVAYFGDNASNVLRITAKGQKQQPKLFKVIPSSYSKRKLDKAIYKFLSIYYDFGFYYPDNFFNDTSRVIKIDYATLNNTKVKNDISK